MNTKLEIKVFGKQAKQITEGQTFVATLGSVEGHTVVTLVPEEDGTPYNKEMQF